MGRAFWSGRLVKTCKKMISFQTLWVSICVCLWLVFEVWFVWTNKIKGVRKRVTESCGKERKAKTEEKGESTYSFGFSPIPGWYKKSLKLTFSFSLAIFSLYIFLRSFCEHFNFCFCLMGICHSSAIYIKCHFDFFWRKKNGTFFLLPGRNVICGCILVLL